MDEKFNILLFNFPVGAMLPSEIREHFSDENTVIEAYETPLEASEFLNQADEVLFIFLAKDKQDFSQVKLLLKRFKNKITGKKLKPIALLKDYNRDAVSVLKRLGCEDVFNHQVSTERLIQAMEGHQEAFLFHDPDIDDIEGFPDEEIGTIENKDLAISIEEATELDKTIIHSVTDTNQDDSLHYKAIQHPKLGGISLESGKMELNVSEELPKDSEFFLEHFDSNELEFEIKTEDAVELEAGQEIEVQVVFLYDRCRVEIMVAGKINEVHEENAASSIVAVSLADDESLKLEQFMALYQKRQSQISEFMELAKAGILYNPFKKGEVA